MDIGIVIFCIAGCILRNAVMIVLRDSQEIIMHMLYDSTSSFCYKFPKWSCMLLIQTVLKKIYKERVDFHF